MGALALAAALAVTVPACGTSGGGPSGSEATLRMAATASGPFTEQFNPLLISSMTGNGYSVLSIYEQLMMEDFESGTIEPWLADSYEWSDGGKTLTLQIHPGVKWSDGTDLTAEDVAFTFDLMLKNKALNSQALPLRAAAAPSKQTAVISFSEPAYQSVWWRSAIVPQALWTSVEDPVKYTNPQPVGSGPFVLASFSPQVITLRANPHYWRQGSPKIAQLQYLAYDSDSSAVSALQAGQVDWIAPAVSDPRTVAERAPGKIGYRVGPRSTGVIFLLPNQAAAPLSDVAVRRAISAAIDRDELSTAGLSSLNAPIDSPVGLNPASEGELALIAPKYQELRTGPADPAKARSILEQAGYTKGGDGMYVTPAGELLNLELMVPTSSAGFGDMVRAGQVISEHLAAAGIKVTVKTESPTAWRDDINVGNYQMSLRSVGGTLSFYDRYEGIMSQTELVGVGKKALANFERYDKPEAEKYLQDYRSAEPGSPAEKAALEHLQDLMVGDVPVIPLYLNAGIGMWRLDRFQGWPSDTDPYATPVGAGPGVNLILSTITPVTS